MKPPAFRQARINSKNRSEFYYEGMIVQVIDVDMVKKVAIIRVNDHSMERSIHLDWLDL